MKNRKKNINAVFIALLFILFTSNEVPAQQKEPPKGADAAKTESKMAPLDFLVGDWKGEGWIQMGREKKTFEINESFTRKLNNSLVVVEGVGTNVDEKTGEKKVIHNAYGIFYFDAASGKIAFRYFKEGGEEGFTNPEFSENKMIWGFVAEPTQTKIRFTETIDENGNWVEIGEAMPKGMDQWFQFFYMKLKKVK